MTVYAGYRQIELLPSSADWPVGLAELTHPPEKLYLIGNPDALSQPAIAIVGSRKATPYGLICAQRFARRAAFQGLTVVSGGAVGCDQAAHQGALELESQTIVVLGCGADVVYPNKAKPLFEQILANGGLIVSELPWGAPPASWAFVKRNRLIAALAEATLIIEAGIPSGTFSTADATLALGRELLVVPGSILSKQSAGCNYLLSQGAWPIIDDKSFDTALFEIFAMQSFSSGEKRVGRQKDTLLSTGANAVQQSLPVITEDLQLLAISDELIGAMPGYGGADDSQGVEVGKSGDDTNDGQRSEQPLGSPKPPEPTGSPKPPEPPGPPTSPAPPAPPGPPDKYTQILEHLRVIPAKPDELVGYCGGDVVEVIRCLTRMEINGLVTRMIDGRFASSIEKLDSGR